MCWQQRVWWRRKKKKKMKVKAHQKFQRVHQHHHQALEQLKMSVILSPRRSLQEQANPVPRLCHRQKIVPMLMIKGKKTLCQCCPLLVWWHRRLWNGQSQRRQGPPEWKVQPCRLMQRCRRVRNLLERNQQQRPAVLSPSLRYVHSEPSGRALCKRDLQCLLSICCFELANLWPVLMI